MRGSLGSMGMIAAMAALSVPDQRVADDRLPRGSGDPGKSASPDPNKRASVRISRGQCCTLCDQPLPGPRAIRIGGDVVCDKCDPVARVAK